MSAHSYLPTARNKFKALREKMRKKKGGDNPQIPKREDETGGDEESKEKLSATEISAATAVGLQVERLQNVIDVLVQEICLQGWYFKSNCRT
jgi:hypothetical protein